MLPESLREIEIQIVVVLWCIESEGKKGKMDNLSVSVVTVQSQIE